MELLKKDSFLEFNPDTLQHLRRQYDLDKPGRIEEAIDLLEEWITKQTHFEKKDFSRDYLERTLINLSKGSVEKAKVKLDKLCTFRTLFPDFFRVRDFKNPELLQNIYFSFLPKLSKDNYRTLIVKNAAKSFPNGLLEHYQYCFMQQEYLHAHDYCKGLVIVLDYTEGNLLENMKVLNPIDLKNVLSIIKEGYGMRIKAMHLLSQSKAIEALVTLLKQLLSDKLSARVMVHTTNKTLHEHIPREILPRDYGGEEMSLREIHTRFQDILTSKEFTDYLIEMNLARTNEKLRFTTDEDEALGIPGSFRKLTVD